MIANLQKSLGKMHEDQILEHKEKDDLRHKITYWKQRSDAFESDKNFLQG